MSVAVLERESVDATTGDFAPCHAVDDNGVAICGASLTRTRPQHSLADCHREGHETCATCDSLDSLPRYFDTKGLDA